MASFKKAIAVWENVTVEVFHTQISPLREPAILKGFCKDWPVANQGTTDGIIAYLNQHYSRQPVEYVHLPAHEKGRFFYSQDMQGFNYRRKHAPFDFFINHITEAAGLSESDTFAMQGTSIGDFFPGIVPEDAYDFFRQEPESYLWVGNQGMVASHFDESENIACNIYGKRRFTLFPPGQVKNLYPGPLEFNPAGAMISMVDIRNPDFETYPRFREALDHALVAELEPGDGLYIPTLWWHNVEALEDLNVMINFWYPESSSFFEAGVSGTFALLAARYALQQSSPQLRQGWKEVLEYFVFEAGQESFDYIPEDVRGLLGEMDEEKRLTLLRWFERGIKTEGDLLKNK